MLDWKQCKVGLTLWRKRKRKKLILRTSSLSVEWTHLQTGDSKKLKGKRASLKNQQRQNNKLRKKMMAAMVGTTL